MKTLAKACQEWHKNARKNRAKRCAFAQICGEIEDLAGSSASTLARRRFTILHCAPADAMMMVLPNDASIHRNDSAARAAPTSKSKGMRQRPTIRDAIAAPA